MQAAKNSEDWVPVPGPRVAGTKKPGRRKLGGYLANGIAERLKGHLADHNIDRREFARRLRYNLSKSSHRKRIGNLLRGRLDPADVVDVCEEFRISADYLLLGREPREFEGLTEGEQAQLNEALRSAIRANLQTQDLDPVYIEEQIPQDPMKTLTNSILERINWETVAHTVGFSSDEVTLLRLRPRPKRRGKPSNSIAGNQNPVDREPDL